jgi:PPOX class probable F420-dependent enzyme
MEKIFSKSFLIQTEQNFIPMPAQKIPESAKKIIRGKNFANLATVMPDGSPQVTPVWVDLEDNTILVNTAEGRIKYRNLKQNPKVAISIFEQSNPYNKVLIRGRAIEITSKGADEHIDKLSMKYTGNPKYPYRQPGEKRVIIRIEPLRVSS